MSSFHFQVFTENSSRTVKKFLLSKFSTFASGGFLKRFVANYFELRVWGPRKLTRQDVLYSYSVLGLVGETLKMQYLRLLRSEDRMLA